MSSFKYLLVMLFSIAVVACGGGGGGSSGPTVPGTPTTVTASPRNASAIVSFTAPANNGGAAITGYTVTSNPAGGVDSNAGTTGLSHTITGLTNGTAYTFTVVATNSVGNSASSTASNSVTPAATATVPGAPSGAAATAGNTQATVTFAAPASDGGAAITGYTVTSNPAGGVDSNAATTGLTHTITNLTNGTAYTFTVVATNSVGPSAASTASNSVTPTAAPTAPGAPTGVAATAGNASASVSFTAPASDGGATITDYTVTSSPGGFTKTGTASPLTVTGLSNGTSYTFTVVATNSVGNSPASSASNAVTPVTVPGAPTGVTGVAGNAQVTVSFTAPANTGGAAITGYTVTSNPAGGVDSNAGTTGLTHTITGLTNNTPYTFTVVATNSAGPSAASSPSSAVTPVTGYTVPGVPTAVAATAGNTSATVSFTAPASTGGTTITGYTVTSHPAGGVDSNAGTTGLNHTITGLTNGVAYTFTVVATNSVGDSPASSASNSVTPALAPVSGAVTTGPWVTGVTIKVTGTLTTQTTTDSTGAYSLNLAPGSYTLAASLPGYTFSSSVNVTVPANSSTAITGNNFTETQQVQSNSITGTLSYAGTGTGGISVRVFDSGCTVLANCQVLAATHLSAQAGSFSGLAYTIRGLQFNGNSYVVKAGIGTAGTGYPNAGNAGGSVTLTTPTQGSDVTGANITITDKTTPTPVALTGLNVAPGNGGALVAYNPPVDVNGNEIATSYKLTWGTDTAASNGGSHIFKAQGTNQNVFLMGDPNAINADGTTVASTALANATAYYFSITPYVGTTAGTAYVTTTASTIGAVSGGNTVSGTVSYTGTATGRMYIAVHDQGGGGSFSAYGQVIASPSSGGSYSVTGVPAGTWYVAAIIDQNHNGEIDAGDISNANDSNGPAITVAGATTSNLTLPSANATVTIATDHQSTGTPPDNYSVNQFLSDGMKHIVKVTMFSGPNVAVPHDIGDGQGNGNFNNYEYIGAPVPSTSDVYQFKFTYSDGTSEVLSGSPTGVLNSFAGLSPVTNPTSATPTFTWTAPGSPPASYLYTLSVYPQGGGSNWYYPSNSNGMPSTQLSVAYNADGNAPLLGATGTCMGVAGTCIWQVQVKDANTLNTATMQSTFTH